MSLTAGPRLSGLRGSAPQMSEVHPILRLRPAAEPSDGRAAAPRPASRAVVKSRREIVVRHGDPGASDQNRNLNPSRNRRSSMPSRPLLAVPLMMPKLLAFTLF